MTKWLAVVFFLFGLALVVRAFRAERGRQARYLKASAGAMAVAAGNALWPKPAALFFFLAGAWLIFSAGRM